MTERFDIVVVGAGSAGCVLAGRLSQDPSCRVLLVEAGPDGSSAAIDGDSFFDALAADGRTSTDLMAESSAGGHWFRYPVGRGIGGSSAVNAMLATWGMPADYDRWERDLGCNGWSWADVAPVFARLAIPVTQPTAAELGAVDRALIDAALAMGHPLAPGQRERDPIWSCAPTQRWNGSCSTRRRPWGSS
jgi:choline dehydrogenase-like flavoprotein